MSGNITNEDGDIVASVSVETDECGAVDSVVYNADIDITRTPEENLAFAEESFVASTRRFPAWTSRQRESSCWIRGSSTPPFCPRNSARRFLTGDYYTAIDTDLDDTGTLRAWALFDTELKEEFDEYTNASISIYLLARA